MSNLIIVSSNTNDDYTLEAEQKQQGEKKLKELGKERQKLKERENDVTKMFYRAKPP